MIEPVLAILFIVATCTMVPLHERIFYSSQLSNESTSPESDHPKRYRTSWSEEAMELAIQEVGKGRAIREVFGDYSIPKSTLSDRVNGKGSHSGPPKYLTDTEENELEKFLLGCASVGYAKTRKEVIALAKQIMMSCGINKEVTSGWWDGFCKCHPELVLRTPSSLSLARLRATDSDVVDAYCNILEDVFVKKWLGSCTTPDIQYG